jgi:hypothetical protein
MRFAANLVVMSAASLSLAPIAAQAGTKASDAVTTSRFGTRLSTPVEDKNRAMPRERWLAVLAIIAAGYGAYHVIDSKETSRGS